MLVGRRLLVAPYRQLHRHRLLSTIPSVASSKGAASKSDEGSSSAFGHHLVRLAWPERQRLAGGLVLLAGSSSISIVFPKVMGSVMDACLAGAATGGWTPATAAAALSVLLGAQSVMVATRGRILTVAAERVAARLRTETFSSLVTKHDLAFFDRQRSGELQSRLTSDCASLQKLVVADAVGALRASFLLVGSTAGMLALSPSLFAVSITTFPAATILARTMGERMKARQREVQDALAGAGAEAERALGNIRTLKLFAAESDAIGRYSGRVEAAREQAEAVGSAQALTEAGVGMALQASLLAVLAVGGQHVIDGAMTYGDLSAFLMYSMITGFSAANLASGYAELRRATGASERVIRLLEPAPADMEQRGDTRFDEMLIPWRDAGRDATLGGTRRADSTLSELGEQRVGGGVVGSSSSAAFGASIEFRHVRFAYQSAPASAVLSGLDLHIEAGERVALLGASGSGKSTVAALLAGLYLPDQGEVLVGGVPVAEIASRHLRTELISVVPQEPTLFAGSLRDNLAVGRPSATEAQLRQAAELAGCADFAFEHWERDVGERGLQLSGGQKQRVALARVLLRNTPM